MMTMMLLLLVVVLVVVMVRSRASGFPTRSTVGSSVAAFRAVLRDLQPRLGASAASGFPALLETRSNHLRYRSKLDSFQLPRLRLAHEITPVTITRGDRSECTQEAGPKAID